MGRGVPVGQAYYDDPLLPQLRGNLLVARWGRAGVSRYPLQPSGATYRADEHFLLEGDPQARPVGVSVGRGGRLFVAVSHMAHNEWSPAYPTDLLMITGSDDLTGFPFESYDVTAVPADALWGDLSSSSWSRRYAAHVEILRRGGALLEAAIGRLKAIHPDDPAVNHLPWLAAASRSDEALEQLLECGSREGPMQRQALRALAEFYLPPPSEKSPGGRTESKLAALAATFRAALASPDPQVVQAGLLAYYRLPGELPPEIVSGPARSDDRYLRQAATRLLARRAPLSQLRAMCVADDTAMRMAGVLAAGVRLTVPPVHGTPPEGVVQPYTSPNAEFEIAYADGTVDLREHALVGSFTTAEAWRKAPRTSEQQALLEMLSERLDDDDRGVRLQAAYYLYLLDDASVQSLVAGVVDQARRSQMASAAPRPVDAAWFVGPFDDGSHGLAATHEPERGAIDLSAQYDIGGETRTWRTLQSADGRYDLGAALGGGERASYYAFTRLQSAAPQAMMLLVEAKDGVKVWHNGRLIYENAVLRSGQRYENSVFVDLQPGSNDLVVRIQNVEDDVLAGLSYRALEDVVVTLPEKLGLGTLAERLRASAQAGDRGEIGAEFLDIDWNSAARDGDPERGRKLFGADALGCVKCHAITPESTVAGGPSLAGAGKRFTPAYLVESILLPSKQIAPIFRATSIETAGGELLTGLVVNETAERLELLLPDGTRRAIEQGEIEAREPAELSPMPAGIVKSPDELRDLLAYLLSDDPQAP